MPPSVALDFGDAPAAGALIFGTRLAAAIPDRIPTRYDNCYAEAYQRLR
jgi:hypothetical protein